MDNNNGIVSDKTRFSLAVKAYEHTASYDGAIANYFGRLVQEPDHQQFPRTINFQYKYAQGMRYGENPHQNAAFYAESKLAEPGIASATQLQGKAL